MLTVTLKSLRKWKACGSESKPYTGRYKVLLDALGPDWGDNTPISLLKCLDSNGLDDTLWALQAVPKAQQAERDRFARLLACDYAKGRNGRVLALYERRHPEDKGPRQAIEVARRYAMGQATRQELASAAAYAAAAAERTWQTAHLREKLEALGKGAA